MTRQSGYLTIGLAIALGVASLAGMGLWSRLAAVQQELSASKAAVALWRDSAEACSKATSEAKEAAAKRQRAATQALEAEKARSKVAQSEAARLKALMGAKTVTACPSAEAVSKVRQGLGK